MDESCSQSRLWFRIALGKGEKVGLRLCPAGAAPLPALLLTARRPRHRAPSSPCGGAKGPLPAKQRCGAGTWRGREGALKHISPSAAHGFGPGGRCPPRMRCGRAVAPGATSPRSPRRRFRGREERCAGPLDFSLETWKSRWPAHASWDPSELAARFWRTVRICVSYKPFFLQEEEEILV